MQAVQHAAYDGDYLPNHQAADQLLPLGPLAEHIPFSTLMREEPDRYAHHANLRRLFCKMKLGIIATQSGSTWCGRMYLSWLAYWKKPRLINTIQATEYMLERAHVSQGIHALVLSAMSCCSDFWEEGLEFDTGDIEIATETTTIKLLGILAWMVFCGFPDWKVQGCVQDPAAQERAMKIIAVVQRTAPPWCLHRGLLGSEQAFSRLFDECGQPRQSDADLSISPVDTSWLGIDAPFIDVGREFTFAIGLKRLHTGENKDEDMVAIEMLILSYYRRILSSLVGVMKVQLSEAESIQNKLIGGFLSALMIILKVIVLRRFATEDANNMPTQGRGSDAD